MLVTYADVGLNRYKPSVMGLVDGNTASEHLVDAIHSYAAGLAVPVTGHRLEHRHTVDRGVAYWYVCQIAEQSFPSNFAVIKFAATTSESSPKEVRTAQIKHYNCLKYLEEGVRQYACC